MLQGFCDCSRVQSFPQKNSSHSPTLIQGFPQDFTLLCPLAETTETHLLSSNFEVMSMEIDAEPGRLLIKNHSKVLKTWTTAQTTWLPNTSTQWLKNKPSNKPQKISSISNFHGSVLHLKASSDEAQWRWPWSSEVPSRIAGDFLPIHIKTHQHKQTFLSPSNSFFKPFVSVAVFLPNSNRSRRN